jgi:hypothetical protein
MSGKRQAWGEPNFAALSGGFVGGCCPKVTGCGDVPLPDQRRAAEQREAVDARASLRVSVALIAL